MADGCTGESKVWCARRDWWRCICSLTLATCALAVVDLMVKDGEGLI